MTLIWHILSSLSQANTYIFAIIDSFSQFVVTNPTFQMFSRYAIESHLHHWITNFGLPLYSVTDRGTEIVR